MLRASALSSFLVAADGRTQSRRQHASRGRVLPRPSPLAAQSPDPQAARPAIDRCSLRFRGNGYGNYSCEFRECSRMVHRAMMTPRPTSSLKRNSASRSLDVEWKFTMNSDAALLNRFTLVVLRFFFGSVACGSNVNARLMWCFTESKWAPIARTWWLNA